MQLSKIILKCFTKNILINQSFFIKTIQVAYWSILSHFIKTLVNLGVEKNKIFSCGSFCIIITNYLLQPFWEGRNIIFTIFSFQKLYFLQKFAPSAKYHSYYVQQASKHTCIDRQQNNLLKLIKSLLHIVPFCEGSNKKPEGFAKQKQPAIFAMRHASQLVQHHPLLIYNVPYFIAALL